MFFWDAEENNNGVSDNNTFYISSGFQTAYIIPWGKQSDFLINSISIDYNNTPQWTLSGTVTASSADGISGYAFGDLGETIWIDGKELQVRYNSDKTSIDFLTVEKSGNTQTVTVHGQASVDKNGEWQLNWFDADLSPEGITIPIIATDGDGDTAKIALTVTVDENQEFTVVVGENDNSEQSSTADAAAAPLRAAAVLGMAAAAETLEATAAVPDDGALLEKTESDGAGDHEVGLSFMQATEGYYSGVETSDESDGMQAFVLDNAEVPASVYGIDETDGGDELLDGLEKLVLSDAGTQIFSEAAQNVSEASGTSSLMSSGDGDGSDSVELFMGTDGNDVLIGGAGDDKLIGGAGDDKLFGGAGDDILIGGAGNDYLDGGDGQDVMYAGSGDDVVVYDHSDSLIDGGSGIDALLVDKSEFTGDITDLLGSGHSKEDGQPLVNGFELVITGDGIDKLGLTSLSDFGITVNHDDDNASVTLGEGWTLADNGATATTTIEGVDLTMHIDNAVTVNIDSSIQAMVDQAAQNIANANG